MKIKCNKCQKVEDCDTVEEHIHGLGDFMYLFCDCGQLIYACFNCYNGKIEYYDFNPLTKKELESHIRNSAKNSPDYFMNVDEVTKYLMEQFKDKLSTLK